MTEWLLVHTLWILRYPRVLHQVLALVDLELNGKKVNDSCAHVALVCESGLYDMVCFGFLFS